eukprot:5940428-Karenia_brevis.AAC.1
MQPSLALSTSWVTGMVRKPRPPTGRLKGPGTTGFAKTTMHRIQRSQAMVLSSNLQLSEPFTLSGVVC